MKKIFFLSFCLLLATIGSLKAQAVKVDSLKLLKEKYPNISFSSPTPSNVSSSGIKVKGFTELERLLKSESERIERAKNHVANMKKKRPLR